MPKGSRMLLKTVVPNPSSNSLMLKSFCILIASCLFSACDFQKSPWLKPAVRQNQLTCVMTFSHFQWVKLLPEFNAKNIPHLGGGKQILFNYSWDGVLMLIRVGWTEWLPLYFWSEWKMARSFGWWYWARSPSSLNSIIFFWSSSVFMFLPAQNLMSSFPQTEFSEYILSLEGWFKRWKCLFKRYLRANLLYLPKDFKALSGRPGLDKTNVSGGEWRRLAIWQQTTAPAENLEGWR